MIETGKSLQDLLAELAKQRRYVANVKEQKAQLEAEFYTQHKGFFDDIKAAQDNLTGMELAVRDTAVRIWLASNPRPDKTFWPGITIRENKEISYFPPDALLWALDHRLCLKVDEAAYKKLVLAGQAPGTATAIFTAAIAANLDILFPQKTTEE